MGRGKGLGLGLGVCVGLAKARCRLDIGLAQALLRQCMNEVQKTLTEHQMHMNDIDEYLKPVEQLLDKVELWRNPSDGLAIFLDSDGGMRYFMVPISFEAKTYVAGHFYL